MVVSILLVGILLLVVLFLHGLVVHCLHGVAYPDVYILTSHCDRHSRLEDVFDVKCLYHKQVTPVQGPEEAETEVGRQKELSAADHCLGF